MSNECTVQVLRRSVTAAMLSLVLLAGCRNGAAPVDASTKVATETPQERKATHQPFTAPPKVKKNLYPSIETGPADVSHAIAEAGRTHKRVILDFGGDWCGDCQVLDIYFNQSPNKELLEKYFVKVNVNIGHQDANVDLAHKYGVPLEGVPALAVLDEHGKVLYSQSKEFSDMRYMEPQSVTEFLNKWKS